MAVITISRGSYAGGKLVAERVAELLGYKCVSREMVFSRAAEFGASEVDIKNALSKAPSFWQRFTKSKIRYLAFARAALLEQAARDNIVYHGLAGSVLLQHDCCVLNVKVIANMEFRTQKAMETQKMTRDEAIQYNHDTDEERVKWMKFMFNLDWYDYSRFDLMVNINSMNVEAAAHTVAACAGQEPFVPSAFSDEKFKQLNLASQVRVRLMADERTEGLNLFPECGDMGVIHLKGDPGADSARGDIIKIAQSVPGVKNVVDDMKLMISGKDYNAWG